MASLEKRLAELEARYGVGSGQFDPVRDAEQRYREWVITEAIRRLTDVELAVFKELMELRDEHPDISGAEFYRLMTKAQHALERKWPRLLKEVMSDGQAAAN